MEDPRPQHAGPSDVRPAEPWPGGYPTWILEAPPRPPKFQHRYGKHVLLLVLTFYSTALAGSCQHLGFELSTAASTQVPIETLTDFWWLLVAHLPQGLYYAIPILTILGAHEFGHYYYCRVHDVDATLPYFLPFPFAMTGTFGAVIRIKEAFPSKKALFDIGVAGPIAGFLALLPFLWWGVRMSATVAFPEDSEGVLFFGEPLLLKAVFWLQFGPLPEGMDYTLHPMGFAAWFGMLATALNLLPFGQLDGGHIAYSVFGRRSAMISAATLVTAMVLFFTQSSSWFIVALMMLVMALALGLRHPRIIDEHTPLDGRRQLVAFLALLIFLVCFTPVPISDLTGW